MSPDISAGRGRPLDLDHPALAGAGQGALDDGDGGPGVSRVDRDRPLAGHGRGHGGVEAPVGAGDAGHAALREVGYDGWLTFECQLRGRPEEALPASTRFLRGFLDG